MPLPWLFIFFLIFICFYSFYLYLSSLFVSYDSSRSKIMLSNIAISW